MSRPAEGEPIERDRRQTTRGRGGHGQTLFTTAIVSARRPEKTTLARRLFPPRVKGNVFACTRMNEPERACDG